mmetsp:Transcript_5206/g.6293  ORF Transcript_5206/g.6293 Transcript_5206/m.6293 type:complete len:161 (-) Transcript_5206:476-958(-)|eukprot:CAMPEP_0184025288 /NCGR_PEP_ID=MMETSP0954-20121128/12699_1 /TAXON_ID=627963 /ORGANISM="Aplanochytrium sp, Strain PBS07" /LENGTH=160 /DNA_ID=CAMNT_0026308999 /DNA_START=739 /DNA_END=1221 /DNA_ORIENTATION=-
MDFPKFLGYQKQRYVFVAKHITVVSFSSVTFGIVGGIIGSLFFPVSLGPVLLYLTFSSFGFGFGSAYLWNREKSLALYYYARYPRLIERHIIKDFQRDDTSDIKEDYELHQSRMSFGNMSWLILGCQAAREDINDIETRKISQTVDEYAEEGDCLNRKDA